MPLAHSSIRFLFPPVFKVRFSLLLLQPLSLFCSLSFYGGSRRFSGDKFPGTERARERGQASRRRGESRSLGRSAAIADRSSARSKPRPLLPLWLLLLSFSLRARRRMEHSAFDLLPEIREKAKAGGSGARGAGDAFRSVRAAAAPLPPPPSISTPRSPPAIELSALLASLLSARRWMCSSLRHHTPQAKGRSGERELLQSGAAMIRVVARDDLSLPLALARSRFFFLALTSTSTPCSLSHLSLIHI